MLIRFFLKGAQCIKKYNCIINIKDDQKEQNFKKALFPFKNIKTNLEKKSKEYKFEEGKKVLGCTNQYFVAIR